MMKPKTLPEISLFLPAYNEEKVIAQTITKSVSVLKKVAKKYEVLVVNDGSTDKTEQVVNKIIKRNKNVRMITHNPNKGYGGALKTGLYESKYKYIAFIDADGQFDLNEIGSFIEHIKENDLVIGYRRERADSSLRIGTAYLLKLWNLMWFQFWVKDTDCGFKLIKKDVVNKLPRLKTESAITETEFLIRAKRAGFKIKEVPVNHYPRTTGSSTGGNFKVIFKAAKETLSLWWALKS
jgi:glycosyltransferase involved in cell wall biosynthesis